MILDKVFHGVLDQGRGCLLVFDEPEMDVRLGSPHSNLITILTIPYSQNTYGAAIDTLEQVGKVVDSLYAKVHISSPNSYAIAISDVILAVLCRLSRLHDVGRALVSLISLFSPYLWLVSSK